MTTKPGRRWALAVILTFNLLLQTASAMSPAPVPASVGRYGHGNHQIDALLSRRDLGDPLLQKATVIIKTKLAGSTSLQDAAAKLIKTCAASIDSGSKASPSGGAQKETAQQIYAIQATDHSLASANQVSPKACSVFCGRAPPSWFRRNHVQVLDSDNLNESAAGCIQELFKVDNLWTSYSTHLQDARTLCEVGSVDHAPRAMLELLRDIAEAAPPVAEMLKDALLRQQELREQMRKHAEEADARHRDRLRKDEELHVASMHRADEMFGALQRQASQLENSLHVQLLQASDDVGTVSQALQTTVADIWTLRDAAALLLQHYNSGFEEIKLRQSQGMDSIERSFLSSIQSIDLAAGGVLDQFDTLSSGVRSGLVDMSKRMENLTQKQHEVASLQADSKQQLLQVLSIGHRLNDAVSAVDGKIGGLLLVIEACERLVRHFSVRGLLAAAGLVAFTLLLTLVWSSSAAAVFFLVCVSAAAAPAAWDLITCGLVFPSSDATALAARHPTALALGTGCLVAVVLAGNTWRRRQGRKHDNNRLLEAGCRHKPVYRRSLRAQSAPPDLG